MNYSADPSSVRVDFFRESGKWYATEAIPWSDYDGKIFIRVAFERSLANHLWNEESKSFHYDGMWAICIEPYHEHSHPVMMKVRGSELIKYLGESQQALFKTRDVESKGRLNLPKKG